MVFLAKMSNLSSKANYFFCLKVYRFITDNFGYSISNICIRAAKIFQNYLAIRRSLMFVNFS